jgi:hypothetical protein
MGAGMLWPHVQQHGFTFERPVRDQVPKFVYSYF